MHDSAYFFNHSVQLWKISFNDFSDDEKFFKNILSSEEIERAARFHFVIDSIRYKVTKAVTKIILGKILSKEPQAIKFEFNAHGKPFLKDNKDGIQFNASHSGELGLLAITDIGPLGVDIERYRKNMLTEKFARRFFSLSEVKSFLALPQSQKEAGFFNCWTRKEAFIKALGLGLAMPLKDFTVTLIPEEKAALKEIKNLNENVNNWLIKDIPLPDAYAAAYAIKAKAAQENCWLVEKNLFNREHH